MNAVIPWLNLYFLNFHIVLLHLPALDCGIKTPNTSRNSPSGSAELLTCTLQQLRNQPAPFPAGTEFWAGPQTASAADGRSGSSVWVSPMPDSSERGPKVLFPSLETVKIRPLLLTSYILHTVDIVMPLSAKSTSQCAFLTLIIWTISLHQDTYSQARRKPSCVAIQYPSQPPCSACFAHFGTAVSSPAENALKGAFHRNISHLTVFNINLFFFFFACVFITLADLEAPRRSYVPQGLSHFPPHQMELLHLHDRGTTFQKRLRM